MENYYRLLITFLSYYFVQKNNFDKRRNKFCESTGQEGVITGNCKCLKLNDYFNSLCLFIDDSLENYIVDVNCNNLVFVLCPNNTKTNYKNCLSIFNSRDNNIFITDIELDDIHGTRYDYNDSIYKNCILKLQDIKKTDNKYYNIRIDKTILLIQAVYFFSLYNKDCDFVFDISSRLDKGFNDSDLEELQTYLYQSLFWYVYKSKSNSFPQLRTNYEIKEFVDTYIRYWKSKMDKRIIVSTYNDDFTIE